MIRKVLAAAIAVSIGCMAGALADEPSPITLGAILPLTGPGGIIGVQEQRGIDFAVGKINAAGGLDGHKINLAVEDNQAKPDQSVLSFNKLADLQHVPVVFTGYSGPSLAMAPLATRKKVLLVNAGAQADQLANASPYLINTLPTLKGEIEVMSKYLVAHKMPTATILFENDTAGISGRDDFRETYAAAGGKILAAEPVAFGETNYRPALLKLAAANADVMFVVITGNGTPLADQIKQLQIKAQVAGTTFFADPSLNADPAAYGWIHTQVVINSPQDLRDAFHAKYGTDMEFFANQYYNATQIVATAIRHVLAEKKPVTGEAVRDAILSIKHFDGLIPVNFNSNTASSEIDIVRIAAGGPQVLTRGVSD